MKRNVMIGALAGAALAVTTPAFAKPGGGGGGGHGKGGASVGATVGADVGVGVGVGRGATGSVGSTMDSAIQAGRGGASIGATGQGSANANARAGFGSAIDMRGSTSARTRANTDTTGGGSARLGTQVHTQSGMQLTGVVDGMTVVDSDGATVGTVTGIHTVGNGKIRSVQVTLTDGQIITLSPRSLSVDGDVLATTSLTTDIKSQGAANANINGLVNASPNSALASAGVTTLTGLATGLTVEGTGGSDLGTVSQIFVNRSGAVVGIRVALDGGGTVVIPATTLAMDGSTVVTTFVPGG